MKIYKLPQLAELNPEGEFLLGPDEISTKAVYLLYGRMRPKETSRKLAPIDGHEQIICVIKGNIRAKCGKASFHVSAGEAFHSSSPLVLDNMGDVEAIYIAAGGRSEAASAAVHKEEPAKETPVQPTAVPFLKPEPDDDFEITSDDSPEDEIEGELKEGTSDE